jgi:hypothetical protein
MKHDQTFTLEDKEIIDRLRTDDIEIVNEIHKTCFDILYQEEERKKSIDAKGASLVGSIGLSVSLVFSLGGIIIEKINNVDLPVIGCPIPWLVGLYFSSSLTLLIAIIYSFFSVKTRSDWRWLKDTDIFNEKEFGNGVSPYKRYMSVHAWKIFRNNFKINEEKANYLKRSQQLFVFALFQLVPIIIILSMYTFKKGGYF